MLVLHYYSCCCLASEKDDHNEKTFSFQTQGQATEGGEKVTRKSPGLMQA